MAAKQKRKAAKRDTNNKKTFKLILENEDLGAWMAINNAFTCRKRRGHEDWPEEDYWNGVLVQLGRFKRLADEKKFMDRYSKIKIEFYDKKEPMELSNNYRELWINVVDTPTKKRHPMQRAQCQDLLIGVDHKRLHHYLVPDRGGITLWPNKGYRVNVEPTGARNSKRSFSFEFERSQKGFTVDVYREEEKHSVSLKNVKQITVCAPRGAQSDTHKNPPQRP